LRPSFRMWHLLITGQNIDQAPWAFNSMDMCAIKVFYINIHQVWHEWDSSRIFYDFFSSSKHHPKRPPWHHRWSHRTKFTFKLMPWWQGTSTPSLRLIGHFLNFLRFFSSKNRSPMRPPWRHRRWHDIEPTRKTISGWRGTSKFNFILIPRWQGTSTPSLAWMGKFPIFFFDFFQAANTIRNGHRDVIDVIEPSLLSN
jgi:hypothetical protein